MAVMEFDHEFFEETRYSTPHHAFRAVMKPGEQGIMTWSSIIKRGNLDFEVLED